MGWLDSIAASAGLKALQAGADMRIMQLGMFDLSGIPAPLKGHADSVIAARFSEGVLTPDDVYSAGILKLAVFYSVARKEGAVEMELVMRAACRAMSQRGGDAIGPAVTFEVMDLLREAPPESAPEPPPLPTSQVPSPSVDFDEEQELLWGDYDEGAISDEEYNSRFRQLLLDEVADLVDRRLRGRRWPP
ncbi:hypothetical protein [Pseudoxanthomonas mexicana]